MFDKVLGLINDRVPHAQANLEKREAGNDVVYVESNAIELVCKVLRDSELDFNVLHVITGCDYEDRIEVSYIINSFTKNYADELILKVKLPRDNPSVDSVYKVYKSAEWQERECYDMLGVTFNNHPDLRRILCPEDWEGFPLRKDYKPAEKYLHMTINPEEKMNLADREFADKLKEQEKAKKAQEKGGSDD